MIGTAAKAAEVRQSPVSEWLIAAVAGLSVAWPLLYAALRYGPRVLIRCLTGDSYHYLAIARKAQSAHIYTYDGVHVTNGFHPMWEWTLRLLFAILHLRSHDSQAVAAIFAALLATTIGVILASAAVVRMTGSRFLGLLVVPGVYYLVVGVHVRNLWIWASLDGMESALSVLFGGAFFFVMSSMLRNEFNVARIYRGLGLVLPFVILSRLDDVFVLPALLIALVAFEPNRSRWFKAGAWVAGPSAVAVLCYLIYNKLTVGAAMPLSGGTKSGFVGALFVYLAAGLHLPMLMDLKSRLTKTPGDPAMVFGNSFRFVEVLYPLVAVSFGAMALWRAKHDRRTMVWFGLCLFIVFKMAYNLLEVHPWHQAQWYYAFIMLSLSVMAAGAVAPAWSKLSVWPVAKYGVATVYVMLMLLSGSQYYASIAYASGSAPDSEFWVRKDLIRQQLVAHGVTGIVNEDDGITAFLLDMPNLHGFAFATDVEGQKAHKAGKMLSLGLARGINTIAGAVYLSADQPPQSDAEIHEYLRKSLAWETMHGEADQFEFSLAYWDPVLKMPFFSFRPRG